MADGSGAQKQVVSDHPFLAFVNAVADDGKTRNSNLFSNGAELTALLVNAGIDPSIEPPDAAQLRLLLAFREAAFGMLSARAADRAPRREDMLVLEAIVKSAISDSSLHFGSRGLRFRPAPGGGLMDALALAFIDLTTSLEFVRLKECHRCTRLFLDHGRGKGRRWCEMSRCGNRAKAESFRARKRAKA